jgi:uncharacterized protein YxeA
MMPRHHDLPALQEGVTMKKVIAALVAAAFTITAAGITMAAPAQVNQQHNSVTKVQTDDSKKNEKKKSASKKKSSKKKTAKKGSKKDTKKDAG